LWSSHVAEVDVQVVFGSVPGAVDRWNEDFVIASPTVTVVLDGLSAPTDLGTGCIHTTSWYAAQLGTRLLLGATTQPDAVSLAHVTAEAIDQVADLHRHTCDLGHPGTPSASVTFVRVTADAVDYLILFDSVILLDGPGGIRTISDRRVDAFAQDEHRETQRHPIGSPEHRRAVNALVARQRQHRNKPGGYWVGGAIAAAAQQAVTGSVPRSEVNRVVLMTDGVSCLVEGYALHDWPQFLELLDTEGTDALIQRIRAAEAGDPRGDRWPRYKASDDATIASCWLADA
jgi:hypothetical protein